ncbi:MAG: hypothetical protein KDD14_23655 [Saprospiraceae bacterium]|nr:hypothetical protein [Saprospiraceae bacterium]
MPSRRLGNWSTNIDKKSGSGARSVTAAVVEALEKASVDSLTISEGEATGAREYPDVSFDLEFFSPTMKSNLNYYMES